MAERNPSLPDIRVVIVTWNSEKHVGACLDSLSSQTGVELRVVVVDNASSDRSVEIARAHGVEVVENEENVGFARAANQVSLPLEEAYLLLLNPDTEVPSDTCLRDATEILAARPRVGTLGPRIHFADGNLQPTAFAAPTLARELVTAWYVYKLLPRALRGRWLLGPHWSHDSEREVAWLLGAFLLVKREAWSSLEGLTEDFHMFSEDMDWGIRSNEQGWVNLFVPSLTIRHLSNKSAGLRWGKDRSEVSFRSYYRYLGFRHGRRRRWSSAAVNWSGFVLRRCVYSLKTRRTTDAGIAAWHEEYKRLESFHRRMVLRPGSIEGE